MQLWRNDVNLYAIIMDKNVAGLKICSTKLTEVTKNKINTSTFKFLIKTVLLHHIQMYSSFTCSYGEST